MNPEQQELFDLAILRVLDRNRTRFGITAGNVRILMAEFAFHGAALDTVKDRIDYLIGKKLVEEVNREINKANRCFRITDAGIEHVDQHASYE